jgi:hypothetical protein
LQQTSYILKTSQRDIPWQRLIPAIFFLGYLALGLSIFGDYGLSWDEDLQRHHALVSAQYAYERCGGEGHIYTWERLHEYQYRYHGVVFTLPALWLEQWLGLETFRQQFRLRHLMTFLLFWLAAVLFYRILLRRFGHWGWALLGTAFLATCPRIFAHSFFNPKDIPMLALYVLCSYTLLRLWRWPGVLHGLLHGLACGLLIGMRVPGLVVPLLSVLFLLADWAFHRRPGQGRAYLLALAGFLPALAGFTVLFWPFLWEAPWHNLMEAMRVLGQYDEWGGKLIFRGQWFFGAERPWYYPLWWMGITVPVLYLALALAGSLRLIPPLLRQLRQGRWWEKEATGQDWLMLALFLAPLLAVIAKQSIVYDDWRHLYFIYPSLVYLAVLGLQQLWHTPGIQQRGRALLAALLMLSLSGTIWKIARSHPHQYACFNELLMGDQLGRYDLDYWGLSYKQAFEALAQLDGRDTIKVAAAEFPARYNLDFAPPHIRNRFVLTEQPQQADYYLSTYRLWQIGMGRALRREGFYSGEEVHAIWACGSKILGVYRIEGQGARGK